MRKKTSYESDTLNMYCVNLLIVHIYLYIIIIETLLAICIIF